MLPYLSLFGLQIPMYGLMSALGIGACVLFLWLRNRTFHLPWEDVLHTLLYAAVGAVVGAKLLYLLTMLPTIIGNWELILKQPALLRDLLLNGYVFYGGLIGGLLFAVYYLKRYRLDIRQYTDMMAPMIPLFHVFGRFGCFFAGCCYGVEAPWGVVFEHAVGAPNGTPLVPIQLFEAAGNALIFLAMLWLEKRNRGRGLALWAYILLYAPMRFALEFFRGDMVRGHLWFFSTSQWISLLLLAVTAVVLWKGKKPQEDRL